jgi:hypothetical protein
MYSIGVGYRRPKALLRYARVAQGNAVVFELFSRRPRAHRCRLRRCERMPEDAAEAGMATSYFDWLTDMRRGLLPETRIGIAKASTSSTRTTAGSRRSRAGSSSVWQSGNSLSRARVSHRRHARSQGYAGFGTCEPVTREKAVQDPEARYFGGRIPPGPVMTNVLDARTRISDL